MSDETVTETSPESSQDVAGVADGINPAFKEQTEQAEPEQPTAKERATEKALWKLKLKGKEVEVDEQKYREYAQKGAVSTETWQEAAKMKREADDFMRRLKEDPRSVLSDPSLGVDLKKFAEEYLWDQIQDEELRRDPVKFEQVKRDRELEKYRAAESKRLEADQKAQADQMKSHYVQDYDKRLTAVLNASGLPKTDGTVQRIVDYMRDDVSNGFERDPREYVEMVQEDYRRDIAAFLGEMGEDQLEKYLGQGVSKKLRMADLKKLKSSNPEAGHVFVPGKGMVNKPAEKKLSGIDWERSVMSGFKSR